jgi:homoserine dehydrogenase
VGANEPVGALLPGQTAGEFEHLLHALLHTDADLGPHPFYFSCSNPLALLDGTLGQWGAPPSWPATFIVDTSIGSSSSLSPFMEKALVQGASLVVANKKLLAGTQEEFNSLARFCPRRLMCEATVGAGLPIISTLRSLLASGDEILEISGCMSGTLGYICSSLEHGVPFSQSVREAREQGFTEPDPRIDLSGQDVARKALILARLWGAQRASGLDAGGVSGGAGVAVGSVALGGGIELSQIPTQALYPSDMAHLGTEEFLDRLPELDQEYLERMSLARSRGHTLRYTARITGSGCRVGLEEVPLRGSMGESLQGPDNIFQFRTRRYRENPLIVQGPGAGPEVTAAGVVSDLLASAGAL